MQAVFVPLLPFFTLPPIFIFSMRVIGISDIGDVGNQFEDKDIDPNFGWTD